MRRISAISLNYFRCKSHWIIGHSVMKALANAGHEVTVASPFPLKEPINNYHDVFVDNFDMEVNMFESENWSPMQMMSVLSGLGQFLSNSTLNSPNMQQLMSSGKRFDAVIVEVFWVEALYGEKESLQQYKYFIASI